MSADTFTTAMFLITAVIAAGVLISAIMPVFYQMTGTFSSAGHAADQQLRTNIQIILPFANETGETGYARVWMKNTGSIQIPLSDIARSDVICGDAGNFNRLNFVPPITLGNGNFVLPSTLGSGQWSYAFTNPEANNYWNPGDTLEIDAYTSTITIQTVQVYFQFSLPNGFSISDQFPVTNIF